MTTKLIMMMIVIKMMIPAAGTNKTTTTKRQPNNFVPALSSLDNVGQQATPLDNALLSLHCFHHHHHHGHHHLILPAKTECQVLSPLEDQKTVSLNVRTVQTHYFAMDCSN